MNREDDDTAKTDVGPHPAAPRGPSEQERSPDALFRSFVANAYEDATPIVEPMAGPIAEPIAGPLPRPVPPRPLPSVNASLRKTEAWFHDAWASSVEELLEDDDAADEGATTVRAAPIASLPDEPEASEDAEPSPPRPAPREAASRARVSAMLAEPLRDTPGGATDVRAPAAEDGTVRVVLLTRKKGGPGAGGDEVTRAHVIDPSVHDAATRVVGVVQSPEWESVVKPPSAVTQRREALTLVPDVAHIEAPPAPPAEGSEDGLMPGGELDRKLSDMAVLLRYGHEAQVRRELDQLTAEYPRDLLLLRRISEFWVGHQKLGHACDALFGLASGLFERRNVEGMRQALEQVLVLSPGHERAVRLLALLAERPGAPR